MWFCARLNDNTIQSVYIYPVEHNVADYTIIYRVMLPNVTESPTWVRRRRVGG